jgi:hypothetical protein
MVEDGQVYGGLERRLPAGAKGAITRILSRKGAKAQRRKGRQEEERVYIRGIIVILSRFICSTIIWLTINFFFFPLPFALFASFAPLRENLRVKSIRE